MPPVTLRSDPIPTVTFEAMVGMEVVSEADGEGEAVSILLLQHLCVFQVKPEVWMFSGMP